MALAPTLTEAGTVRAAELLLDRVTAAPAAGAAPERVTVQLVEEPPATVVAAHVSEESVSTGGGGAAAVTVMETVFETPP